MGRGGFGEDKNAGHPSKPYDGKEIHIPESAQGIPARQRDHSVKEERTPRGRGLVEGAELGIADAWTTRKDSVYDNL